jgi:multidrug efflux pump subunit AcrB
MSSYKIIAIFVFASIVGALLLPTFTVDLQPGYGQPVLTIFYSLPGAPPEVIEQLATAPLENKLSQLSGIDKIYSVSAYDKGSIELSFDQHVNIDQKKFEVSSSIRQLYPKLTGKLSYPLVEQRSHTTESRKPLLVYRIIANNTAYQIKSSAEEIFSAALLQTKGIHEVQFSGVENVQLTIQYNEDRLSRHNIDAATLRQTIQIAFQTQYPGQVVLANGHQMSTKIKNQLTDIRQVKELLIPVDNAYLPLQYFANIFIEETQPQQFFRINGLNAVTLSIYADEGVNRIAQAKMVKKEIDKLSHRLPERFQCVMEYDDSEFLDSEIDKNYLRSALAMCILSLFMLIAYRNWRYLVVLFSGMLVTLCITFIAAYWLNIAIHLYTIAGFTISFGMIMDNSIIILDHLIYKNSRKIIIPITAATFTTVAALLLIFLLPEKERLNLTEFSVIVAVTLGCSIVVAIFYIPAIYHSLCGSTKYGGKTTIRKLRIKARILSAYCRTVLFLSHYRRWIILLLVLAFGLPIFMLPAQWSGQDWYNKTIGSDFYQEGIRPYSDKILGGSLRLFVQNVYERSGYRDPEKTRLYVNASLPYGHTLNDMDRIIRNVEKYLQTVKGIDTYMSRVSSGQHGFITITFDEEYEDGFLPYQLKTRLIAQSLNWGGMEWSIYGVGRGFSNSTTESLSNFKVEMRGYNYHELEQQAQLVADELMKHKRIQLVNTNEKLNWNEKATDHLVLKLNIEQLGASGISPWDIASILKEKVASSVSSFTLLLTNKMMPVYLEPVGGRNFSTYQMINEMMETDSASFSLKDRAQIARETTSNAIHKEDRQYIRQLGFDYYGSYQFGDKYLTHVLDSLKPQFPAGYSAQKVTWSFSWEKAKRQYGLLVLLMLIIYLICAVLFESLRLPLIVVFTIPVSFIGLFLVFGLFEFYFDQGGFAAFVLLGGLVVNSSIFLVSRYIQLPNKFHRKVVKATAGQFRPIILTILSTCLGLSPFLLNGQTEVFWFALAVGTIGGLIISVFNTFIVLPVLLIKKTRM